MRRRRDEDRYIEPENLTVNIDGKDYTGLISYDYVAPGKYHYTVSYGELYKSHKGSFMPDTYICKIHGRSDLRELVKRTLEQDSNKPGEK